MTTKSEEQKNITQIEIKYGPNHGGKLHATGPVEDGNIINQRSIPKPGVFRKTDDDFIMEVSACEKYIIMNGAAYYLGEEYTYSNVVSGERLW